MIKNTKKLHNTQQGGTRQAYLETGLKKTSILKYTDEICQARLQQIGNDFKRIMAKVFFIEGNQAI